MGICLVDTPGPTVHFQTLIFTAKSHKTLHVHLLSMRHNNIPRLSVFSIITELISGAYFTPSCLDV